MLITTKKTDSLKQGEKKIKKSKGDKLFNAKKFNGILKLKKDPLEIQKEMRSS